MADIRINSLPTTATSSASDDYIAIDGSANGTRKLSIYSPTLGGNLTVSGGIWSTGYASVPADSTSRLITGVTGGTGYVQSLTGSSTNALSLDGSSVTIRTGSYGTAAVFTSTRNLLIDTTSDSGYKLDVNGTARIQSNLTVSGGTSVNGNLGGYGGGAIRLNGSGGSSSNAIYTEDTGSPSLYFDHRATGNTGNWYWRNGTNAATTRMILDSNNNLGLGVIPSSWYDTAAYGRAFQIGSVMGFYGYANGTNVQSRVYCNAYLDGSAADRYLASATATKLQLNQGSFEFSTASSGTAGNTVTWNQAMTLNTSGNLLLGTTTDSANGKLQLATHTTSAGGIGFGTDTSLYRIRNGTLALNDSSGTPSPKFEFYENGSYKSSIYTYLGNMTIGTEAAGGSLTLRTAAGSTALTLDSSQRTILSGPLRLANAYVAGAPTATGYVTIQDSAGTTYKVLVST